MKINNAIIHWVQKDAHKKSTLQKRVSELKIDESVTNFVNNVRANYIKTAKTYGIFNENEDSYPFQKFVRSYLDSEKEFVDFSLKSTNHFQVVIDKASSAKGGYLIFINYEVDDNQFLMVLILNDKVGSGIDRKTLSINDTMNLDVDKLHFVSRLNINKWNTDNNNYITFIKGAKKKGVDYSNYFTDFIGCTDITKPKESTEKLIVAINDYIRENSLEDDAEAIKLKLHSYCTERRKERKPIDLKQLSYYLDDENPDDFFSFANQDKYGLSGSFDADQTTLNRLKKYSYRGTKFSISFAREMLNKTIHYDEKKKQLLITKLPEQLQKQFDE